MYKIKLKPDFIEKYRKLTDFDDYENIINKFLRKAIRVNTLKTSVEKIKKSLSWLNLEKIPWCKEGFWVNSEKRDLGNLKEHKLGYIFVQEAASMIPPAILNPEPKDLVLDMSASPGGKTTHLAQIMKNKGIIIANEKNFDRLAALTNNLNRIGITNTAITLMDGRDIKHKFDKILLDAPCTSSGTIRGLTSNSKFLAKTWNKKRIKSTSGLQKKLILNAYSLLNKKGTLVYSVCSLEPEETEEESPAGHPDTDGSSPTPDLYKS